MAVMPMMPVASVGQGPFGGSSGFGYPSQYGRQPDYGLMNPYFHSAGGGAAAGPGRVASSYADLLKGANWYAQQNAARAAQGPAKPEFETISLTRNPDLEQAVTGQGGLWDQFRDVEPMDYSEWIAGVKSGAKDVEQEYQEYQKALDPSEYIQTRRDLDKELGERTDEWADVAKRVQDTRGVSLDQYAKEIAAIQGRREATTADMIAASRRAEQQEVDQAQRLMSKYGSGMQTGVGSAELRKIARAAGDIRIKYDQLRLAWQHGDIDKAQGIARDLQSLRNQLADYEGRTGEMILDRYGNLIRAEQATAADIERIRTTYAREGLDAAVAQWVRGYQTAQMVADMTNRPVEEILQRAQAAGVLGNLQDVYAYQSVRKTEPFSITQPTYPARYPDMTGIGPEFAYGGPENIYGGEVGGGPEFDPSDPFGIKAALTKSRYKTAVPGKTIQPYGWMTQPTAAPATRNYA